jgi:hypothetical protein
MSTDVPETPEGMLAKAQNIANQMLGLPEVSRNVLMSALRAKNQVMWSLVLSILRDMKGKANG